MANLSYNMQYYGKDNIFTASIGQDGVIYQEKSGGQVPVGADMQTVQEMQATIDNYYEKLVEVGIIKKEKTAEEIAQEQLAQQQQINQTLMESQQSLMAMVKDLNEKIGGLENGNTRDIKASSTSIKKKSNGNNVSVATRKKDDSGSIK